MFYHSNQLGTNTAITDASQATTDTKTYDAFGLLTASTGSTPTPFGFAGDHGYQEDADSGLMLLGHRYYDPSTGRFLTRDPIKDGRNWYSYCQNGPMKTVDPEGTADRPFPANGIVRNDFEDDLTFEVYIMWGDKEKASGILLPPGETSPITGVDVDYGIIYNKKTGQETPFAPDPLKVGMIMSRYPTKVPTVVSESGVLNGLTDPMRLKHAEEMWRILKPLFAPIRDLWTIYPSRVKRDLLDSPDATWDYANWATSRR